MLRVRGWSSIVEAACALVLLLASESDAACSSWSARFKKNLSGVCVCNATSCDSVANDVQTLGANAVGVYRTTKAGDRLTYSSQTFDASTSASPDFVLESNVTFQSMVGFGGAFTDSSAINIYKLTPDLQQQVFDAYFSSRGIEYSTGRVPIASCDFSTSVYSYNPVVDDFNMTHFSIDVDRAPNSHKLDMIHRALNQSTRNLTIFASSWAPPAWMLTENSTLDSRVKGSPGEKYWEALALYYAKFIEAYQAEGIHLWGLTVQNEPNKPILQLKRWQSLRMTPEQERDFIKLDLGPLMRKTFPNLKIMAHDEQKPDLADYAAVFQDAEAMKYIDGVGVHWYKDLDFFFFGLGGDFDKLSDFHTSYPDKFILPTEACEGSLPSFLGTGAGTKLGNVDQMWYRAENYAKDISNDILNWAVGWTDWNLVLDTTGGPNWAGNTVDAPILVDEVNGTEFYKQPMYYILGHYAKFIPANSKRINLRSTSSTSWSDIDSVAFLTPENRVVVVISNRRDSTASVVLQTLAKKTVRVSLPARSIQTMVLAA